MTATTTTELPTLPDGTPVATECLAGGCTETEDLEVFECAPGYTWCLTGGVCGHVAWIFRKEAER